MTRVPAPPTSERGSKQRYDVIIAGSGAGGSSLAALLGLQGVRTLVLEKNEVLGGILASHVRQGFKLDAGSHLIARGSRGPIGKLLRTLGLSHPRLLTHPIPVRARGMFDFTAPRTRMELVSAALAISDRMSLSRRDAARAARMLLHVFTFTAPELRPLEHETFERFLRRHVDHPGLYFLFAFLASIFFVLPPWELSASAAIRGLRTVVGSYSLSYVEGGMDALIHALLGFAVDRGAELVTGARVSSIRKHGPDYLVATEDGSEYRAPIVVGAFSPPDLLRHCGELDLPPDYAGQLRTLRGSGNAHQLKVALRRPLVSEGCLIGGVSLQGTTLGDLTIGTMHRLIDELASGQVPDPLAIYAPIPTNHDPSLAPDGGQIITASIYAPLDRGRLEIEAWRRRSFAALAQVVPGLERELVFAEFQPISQVAAWMGRVSGAAISGAQRPDAGRLPVESPLPGFYLCGDGAGGRGVGLELAVTSAVETAGAIGRWRTGRR